MPEKYPVDVDNNTYEPGFYLDLKSGEMGYYIGIDSGCLVFDDSSMGQHHISPDLAKERMKRVKSLNLGWLKRWLEPSELEGKVAS